MNMNIEHCITKAPADENHVYAPLYKYSTVICAHDINEHYRNNTNSALAEKNPLYAHMFHK